MLICKDNRFNLEFINPVEVSHLPSQKLISRWFKDNMETLKYGANVIGDPFDEGRQESYEIGEVNISVKGTPDEYQYPVFSNDVMKRYLNDITHGGFMDIDDDSVIVLIKGQWVNYVYDDQILIRLFDAVKDVSDSLMDK